MDVYLSDLPSRERSGLREIGLGAHVCSIFRNTEEQFAELIPFLVNGLENNDRCAYVTESSFPVGITDELAKRGLNAESKISSGQIILPTVAETYLAGGSFDPKRVAALLESNTQKALDAGYSGLRVTGETAWISHKHVPPQALFEYESSVNSLKHADKLAAICQYDEREFDETTLINVIRTHPYLIVYGKLYENKYFYTPPQFAFGEKDAFPPSSYRTIISMILEG